MAGEENGGEFESRMDGIFIKVIDVVEDGHVFFCRLPNGGSSRFSFPQPVDLNRGDVIFVNEDQQWFPAPNTAWPDDSSVGVVRKILYDRNKIVVETSGGGMRILSGPQAIEVEPGNTIQYTEIDGVVDVVSKLPSATEKQEWMRISQRTSSSPESRPLPSTPSADTTKLRRGRRN